jgi:predicted DsbA family dithiol-disulfide isomerase
MARITVDVISDMVCPWCYLGKARLELAIAEVQDRVSVDVTFRPYQLNPDMPAEGVDHKQWLNEKLGEEAVAKSHATLTELGSAVGIAFDFDAIKISPNTLNAHRLALWAHAEDPQLQEKVMTLLFNANFEKGLNIGDHKVLADIGVEAGLERAVIERLLASDADKDTVRSEIDAARQMGVSGVPFFIIDQKYAISGAQEKDLFVEALLDVAKEKAAAHRAMN